MITIYTKLKALLISIWDRIKEALRPDWALDTDNASSRDAGTPVSLVDAKEDSQKSSGTENGSIPNPSSLACSADEASPELLKCYEEIARLRRTVTDLEKGLSEQSAITETLSQLRMLAKQGRGLQTGRPPKPHCKMMLNFLKEWSLLYELGFSTHVISCNRTTFINNAVERMFQTVYPELYAVYLRSLSEEISEQDSP